jgi:hypothetical protein
MLSMLRASRLFSKIFNYIRLSGICGYWGSASVRLLGAILVWCHCAMAACNYDLCRTAK